MKTSIQITFGLVILCLLIPLCASAQTKKQVTINTCGDYQKISSPTARIMQLAQKTRTNIQTPAKARSNTSLPFTIRFVKESDHALTTDQQQVFNELSTATNLVQARLDSADICTSIGIDPTIYNWSPPAGSNAISNRLLKRWEDRAIAYINGGSKGSIDTLEVLFANTDSDGISGFARYVDLNSDGFDVRLYQTAVNANLDLDADGNIEVAGIINVIVHELIHLLMDTGHSCNVSGPNNASPDCSSCAIEQDSFLMINLVGCMGTHTTEEEHESARLMFMDRYELTDFSGCPQSCTEQTWYLDADNDGYSSGTALTQCDRPTDYFLASELTSINGDCDDSPTTGITCFENCTTFYEDEDGDGFGNPAVSVTTCIAPMGYVANNTDNCPNDINKIASGDCGCGTPETDCNEVDCAINLQNISEIGTDSLVKARNIEADNQLTNSANIYFKAGETITLKTGFHATSGSIFTAKIGVCNSADIIEVYPNPFKAQTTIQYYLPNKGKVNLQLVEFLGRKTKVLVNNKEQEGWNEFNLDAENLPEGIYYLVLNSDQYVKTQKLMILK